MPNTVNPVSKPDGFTSPKHLLLRVLQNTELCPEHYLITLKTPRDFREPRPGQFFHVVCDPDGKKTLTNDGEERGYALTLRRPFSVHRVHYADSDRHPAAALSIPLYEISQRPISKLDILYKVVGKGTKSLSQVRPDSLLDVIGPIGNGFNIERGRAGVIVAGGIGIAPLVALVDRLCYLDIKTHIYIGAVTHVYLRAILRDSAWEELATEFHRKSTENDAKACCELVIKEFREIGAETVTVCTDDGSVGEKGLVTDILEEDMKTGVISSSAIAIYTCGPSAMMRKVSDLAREYEVPCQVLMEELMACGIGACFSCTCNVRGKDGNVEKKRVCIDGPVFDAREIVWQN